MHRLQPTVLRVSSVVANADVFRRRQRIANREIEATFCASPTSRNRGEQTISRLLLIDAVLCGAVGLLLLVASGQIADALGLSATLIRWVGVGLLPWAMFVIFSSTPTLVGTGVRVVIAGNVVWIVVTLAFAITSVQSATRLGTIALILQALAVVLLTAAQIRARSQHTR